MPSLLKLSEASLLALHALTFLAVHRGSTVSAKALASGCASSAQHMAKVCQRLAKAGLVRAVRGKQGGFRLERAPARMRLAEVLAAFDERLSADGCLLEHAACKHAQAPACIFGPELDGLQRGIADYFQRRTLAQLARRCRGLGAAS
jgi:Rrf2 family protein